MILEKAINAKIPNQIGANFGYRIVISQAKIEEMAVCREGNDESWGMFEVIPRI